MRWNRHHNEAHEDEKIDSEDLMDEDNGSESRLESVRHLIRFGLMNGAYFVKKVMPKRVLTDAEERAILMYYQVQCGGCGPFSTVPRYKSQSTSIVLGEELPFELEIPEILWEEARNVRDENSAEKSK